MTAWSKFLPLHGKPPSALSIGLMVFLPFLFLLNKLIPINDKMSLSPKSIFNLGRLSNYPLIHLSLTHLIFNMLALFGPLNIFEAQHGTVHTGVFLNLSALLSGLMYCIVGKLIYPDVSVAGASGWCFTLFGYFSVKESTVNPRYEIRGTSYSFPTLYMPFVMLVFISLIIPGASFWGHLFGLLVGYFIGFKESLFSKLMPPSWIIIKIEAKLDRLIKLIPSWVKYYKEEDMTGRSTTEYTSIFGTNLSLPLHTTDHQTSNSSGRVLGTAQS
ncbi:hypothetical protein HG535_0A06740 [Zygotorulaspora mrakii]|uniref:Rhomboid-type serine protease 2 n=1 Tax=Zygotorulaspora mrakii TaxID=42260 RepID=A0A7H9AYT1_ZYGMR|nr:uncharacterized protein HG535_0A06740 [Zygotorulaspora mrakii]QLG70732.1 hypothetical protein HG535_0A06740 [Zygotorulaspora mrakii]